MRKLNILILLIVLFCSAGCSVIRPSQTPDQFDRPQIDGALQSKLEAVIFDLGLDQAVHEKHLNLAFVDLADLYHPVMAGVNETNIMYAASLPKIAILFALFKRIENGDLKWTSENKALAEDMTHNSSNTAATTLYHLVGPRYIMELMLKYKLYDKDKFGGLWVGKEYGKGEALARDPIAGTAHGATPFSVLRFYYLLETGQLLNSSLTQTMREVLSKSNFHTKFLKGIRSCCKDAILLRKAGAWRNFNADGALVLSDKKRYIIAGFSDDPRGEEWLEMLAPKLDSLAGEKRS
jgi:beta-lactamase class A